MAISESTPGPIAINAATFVGFRICGFWGALFATLGVVIPSYLIILIISFVLKEFQSIKIIQYAFNGIRAGVLALIIKALWSMYIQCPKNIISYIIMACSFVFTALLNVNVLIVIISCAILGFYIFLKIGAFTFGGGYAMLPLIQDEVIAHNWIDSQSLIDFIAVSESTPGPFAVNIATYVGAEVGGIFGSFCATLGVILPSFIIILIVAKCFIQFQKSIVIKGCMSGLKPAVVGLIGSAVISMSSTVFIPDGFNTTVFTDISFYTTLIIFLISVVLAFKKINPILIICLSAILGIVCGYI